MVWVSGTSDCVIGVVAVFFVAFVVALDLDVVGWVLAGWLLPVVWVTFVAGGLVEVVLAASWEGAGAVGFSVLLADFGFTDWVNFSADFNASFHQFCS